MQLCDDKGCAQPKDYPFSATLRPDVQAVAVAAHVARAQGNVRLPHRQARPASAESSPAANPSLADQRRAAAGRPGGQSAAPAARTRSSRPKRRSRELPRGTEKSIGCRSPMPPNCEQMVGPELRRGTDSRKCSQGRNVGLGIVGAIFAGFVGGLILNIMPCVLPVIGLKILSFVEQAGHNRRKAFMLNVWYSAGLAGGVLHPCVAGRWAAAPGLGRVVRKGLVHDHAGGRGVRHGLELHGRVGSAAADLPGERQGGRVGRAGGRRGGLLQRRIDHVSGHAVQCPVPCPCPGLGHGATGRG